MGGMKMRGLAGLLAVCLLLGLTACGKQPELETEEIDTGTIYASDEVWYQANLSYIQSGCVVGETLYLYGTGERNWGDEGNMLMRLHVSGGVAEALPDYQPVTVSRAEPHFVYNEGVHAAPDGSLVASESLGDMYFTRRLDQDGKELAGFSASKSDIQSLLDAGGQDIYDLMMDSDGDIFVKTSKKAGVLDSSGELRFALPVEEDKFGRDHLVLLGDGRVGVMDTVREDEISYTRLRTVDKDGKNWDKTYLLPRYTRLVDGSGDVLFYYNAGENLCAQRADAEEPEQILNWLNTGYDGDQVIFYSVLFDGRLAVLDRGEDWGEVGPLSVLTPTEDAPEKSIVTYATLGLTTAERSSIIEFNKTSEEYQIRVKDYSEYIVGDTDEAALTRLATEIGAGKIPDILAIYNIPLARWAANGILEDLWPWIDNDPELSRDQLMERVLQAAEIDGKLYEISDGFFFRTVAGRKDVVGDRMTWTAEDMWAALEKMPDGCVPIDGSKTDVLTELMNMDWSRFIDWEKGTCSFDNEEFKSILEFCNSLPEGPSSDAREAWANDGRLMLYTYYPGQFNNVQDAEFVLNGEISFVGYPNPWGKVGSSFDISGGCSITSASKNKEGAWAYLRTLILPQGYDPDDYFSFGFPINKEDFDLSAKEYMKKLTSGRGSRFYSDGEAFEYDYHPVTQEEYDQIMALYNAVDTIYRWDDALGDIITDVAGAYFAGDKSLDETAELIQRRAELYVSEQK